jgi:hypothetical protein
MKKYNKIFYYKVGCDNMERLKKILYLFTILYLFSESLYANDFMMSTSSKYAIFFTFLLWIIILPIMKLIYKDKVLGLGLGGMCVLIFALSVSGHIEFGITIWMFYVGIVFVMYLFGKKQFDKKERKINLWYYGITLLFLIIGGIISKIIYYSHIGGMAKYIYNMRELMPPFIFFYLIISLFVILYVDTTVRKKRKLKSEEKTDSVTVTPQ